jgi:hypothetical protein
VPKQDYESLEGCIKALQSPAASVRYIAWQKLQAAGEEAVAPLKVMAQDANPRMRARALWLLGKISGQTPAAIELAIQDPDSDVRTVALRLARQTDTDVIAICEALVKDPSPQVRREVAIALRNNKSEQVPELWAELAAQHDGKDRWYLEALGIGAEGQWDACFGAWIKLAGERWNTPAGRDIIWRSRATATPGYLAKILLSEDLPAEEQPRYFRAFDFLSGPEKEKALESLLGL